MKRSHRVIVRACSWLAGRTGALIIGLAVVWMAAAPRPAWGQSAVWQPQGATTGNIYYNGGNIGIGTTNPGGKLDVQGGRTFFAPASEPFGVGVKYSSTGGAVYFGANDNTATPGVQISAAGGMPLMTLQNGGNVGIGTTNPSAKLEVSGGNATITQPPGTSSEIAINQTNVRGWHIQNLATSGDLGFNDGAGQWVTFQKATGNVGIGTMNPQYLLSVKGTVGAEEFIVTNTGWSDYVFRPGYRLKPLGEVNAYIQQHHHLPDIPSESEVKEKGVSVGDMQAKLLAKVEELTLHMIQADERNNRLEQQNQELRDRMARLEKSAAADAMPTAAK